MAGTDITFAIFFKILVRIITYFLFIYKYIKIETEKINNKVKYKKTNDLRKSSVIRFHDLANRKLKI